VKSVDFVVNRLNSMGRRRIFGYHGDVIKTACSAACSAPAHRIRAVPPTRDGGVHGGGHAKFTRRDGVCLSMAARVPPI